MSIEDTIARRRGADAGGIEAALARRRGDITAALARRRSPELADLASFQTPEETMANFTDADRDRINEYGPAALAGAAGLLLPGSPGIAALGSMALGTAARAATPLLRGEGVDAALEATKAPGSLLIEGGLPYVGKAVARGLSKLPLSSLADFARAKSLDAALPPLDDLATHTPVDKIAKDTAQLRGMDYLRSEVSASAPYLNKSGSEAARVAGDRVYAFGELDRFIGTNGQKIIGRATKGLNPYEREEVTALLRGEMAADQAKPHVVQAAQTLRNEFYDPIGRLAERSGVLTEVKEPIANEAGEVVHKVGDWVPFRMRSGGNYSPEIPLEDKATISLESLRRHTSRPTQVAFQRVEDAASRPLMTDAHDIAQSYLDTMKRKIAASYAFGSPTKGGKYGEAGDQLLQQLYAEADRDPVAPQLLQKTLDRIYNPPKPDPLAGVMGAATRFAAKVQLGKAALRSIPQIATNVRQHGVANTIEGLTRYATDPSLRELIDASGATSAALADHATDMGVGLRTLPVRMSRGIERINRGVANAGIVPQMEQLHAAAQAGPLTTAQERVLSELRIDPSELNGEMTADLLRRAIQRSADDNQLQAHAIGQVGDFAHSDTMKALTQYQPFQWAQWRQAQKHLVEPLMHPLERPAEAMMGLRRAATTLPALAALSAPVSAIYAASSGREPDAPHVLGDMLETGLGTPGGMASNAIAGRNPLDVLLHQAPAAGLVEEAWKNPSGIPADLAALLDPTGTAAVLRAPLRAYLKGSMQ